MTQHTQPVGAGQHQQHLQQQNATNQQQQSVTTSNPNNNNISNINSNANLPTPNPNNNQTQTVTVQQHLNNNNNSNNNYQSQQQNAAGGQMFNSQLQPANVYVPSNVISSHHHPQHHQPGPMYQTMIPAAIPSNVYVNNVTANVNLHGWSHTVPHGTWVHPSGSPHYIHGDLPPEQGAPVIQQMGTMPVTLPTPNVMTGPVMSPNANVVSGGRGSRRGRGRGAASGSRRGEYNIQRHSQSEGSPGPQQSGQGNQQELQQHQTQQQTDAQQIMTIFDGSKASYIQHPQYTAHAPQYQYGYPTFFTPQQHVIHPGQSAAAQQATGAPLYFPAMPMYNGPQMYNYGFYLPHVINQSDYQYGEEMGVVDERQSTGEGGPIIWHQQPIYSDDYGMSPADMQAAASDDMNHNAPSIGSSNDTPDMLSPNYPPMYEQMTQQMGVMQIYDDPQMGPMQIIHPQQGLPQMEEELSECGSQSTAPIQMVSPIQIVSAVGPPSISLPATTVDQILQQQPPHIIPVTGGVVMAMDARTARSSIPHQQSQQHGDNTMGISIHTHENVSSIKPSDSVTSLNEEMVNQLTDNFEIEYQQQSPPPPQQQQMLTQNVLLESVQPDNYNKKLILINDEQGVQDNTNKPSKVSATDSTVEMVTTNASLNKPVFQQQQSQDKLYKHQEQYESKQQSSDQHQQQYHHQQLQTQPVPQQQSQQQTVPTTQQQTQQAQYQTSPTQQQHQQTHQLTYENRKGAQSYNQQHQSRNRKYEYHHGHSSSSSNIDNTPHQQQPQQTNTKSMSWTNSSQHKKSTNTVAVTATPSISHASGSYNKQSNNQNSPTTHTHGTRTYTNQQHHNYQQQQNYHYQQQQTQPQTRNYGAMKMPSSPISSAPNTLERKTSQSSDKSHLQQPQQQTSQSTSTASTTAVPHQFQQQQSQQTLTNDMVHHTQQSSTALTNTTAGSSATIPSKQQSQHYTSGYTAKKHSLSIQGHSGTNASPNNATTTVTSNTNIVESSTAPAINLAPPVTNTSQTASTTPSWASLFANSSNSIASAISNTSAPTAVSSTTSITSTVYPKKPVAKVAPYEGLSPVTPPPSVVTPGALSYSAASAQNIPASETTSASAGKKVNTIEQQLQRNTVVNLDEYSLKFADFLTKYKSDWATISLRPRGLTNRSNYCYINSILQALLGCSPLYNLIRSIPKQAVNLCEVKTPTVNAMLTFMSNFSNLPAGIRLRSTKGAKGNKDDLGGDLQCDSAFEPTEIYKLWNDSREEHVEGRQEDAEEFLSYILNKLNDEMLEVIKLIAKPNTNQHGPNEPPEQDGDVWQMICNNRNKGSVTRQTDFGCTPLSDIFRGELRSRLQREGEHSTDVIQPFFTLQLNIEKSASVKEALEILVGRDQLEGVTGSKTKQEVVAWQQMNLEKLPPVLILHLKWFDYRSDGCTKIIKKVEFPVELKIDAKILASKKYSQKQRAYRLFAVVYHDGKEATKGHYITDVYHTGYGSWLRYDDSSVKPVNENHVLLPRTPRVPYLLCYRRCDTIPQQSNINQNTASTGNNNSSGNNAQSSLGK